ncbi:MAG: DUF2029 domain-containing protein [Acidobacteria bacterium]|nr:DUF2029 domain-containing protein [Acidobacteriota bacterium]
MRRVDGGGWPRAAGARARAAAWIAGAVGLAYLTKAIYRGLTFTTGDYYYTLSGAYIRDVNPALWASPDLQASIAYNHGTYLYGPTQYLALFPVAFLPSYHAIAMALLAIYPMVLVAAWYGLTLLAAAGERVNIAAGAMTFGAAFAFLPLSQALIQREFEVVALLLIVLACLAFVRGRDAASGALLAAAAWFKYWPIVLLGAFVLHRRFKGIAAFAASSAAILLAAHLAFGLQHFALGRTATTVGGIMRPFGAGEVLYPVIARGAQKSDFCRQWIGGRGTAADVRWLLCAVEDRAPAFSAVAAFYALVGATSGLLLWGAARGLGARREGAAATRGLVWELAVLLIAGASFFHAHYYYYVVFLLPLCALLYTYVTGPQPRRKTKLTLWACTYLLLNGFMLPMSRLSAIWRTDVWSWYLDSGLCLLGIVMLLGLVLWELGHAPVGGLALPSTS